MSQSLSFGNPDNTKSDEDTEFRAVILINQWFKRKKVKKDYDNYDSTMIRL